MRTRRHQEGRAPGRGSFSILSGGIGLIVGLTAALSAAVGDEPSSHSFQASWSLSKAVARSTAPLDDLPGHDLGLSTFHLRRTDDGAVAGSTARSARCSEVTDSLADSGFPTGYCTLLFEDENRLFLRYRGEYRAAESTGATRRVTGSGEWEVVGGTGIFTAAAGSGTWQVKGTYEDVGVRKAWTMRTSGAIEGVTTP